jgi:diguanylate cyclase (GGDEF)-like protein/PAS domain S-box-containing protein
MALVVVALLGAGSATGSYALVLLGALLALASCAGFLVPAAILTRGRSAPAPEASAGPVGAAAAEAEYLSVLETVSEGVMTTDGDGTILTVNEGLGRRLGYAPAEVIGRTPAVFRSEHHDDEFYARMWRSLESTGRWQGRIINRRKDGQAVVQRLAISAVHDEDGAVARYVAVYDDPERDGLEWRDPVTSLAGRDLFRDRLGIAVSHARRNDEKLAVLLVDLTRFSQVNDTLGYLVGDRLLAVVAERLRSAARDHDTLCRWHDSVFAFLLVEIDRPDAAAMKARRIMQSLSQPLEVHEHRIHAGPVIGIAVFPDDGADADDLVKSADVALAESREAGGRTMRFYSMEFEREATERIGLEAELVRAVQGAEFELHYQPKVRVSTGRLVGAEALIRWRHPHRGLVSPGVFIPLAEETELILPISDWTLWTACEQWKRWTTDGHLDDVRVSVNVSPVQFAQPRFLDSVMEPLKELKLNPRLLELEVTEGVLMHDTSEAVRKFQTLQEWGIAISIDDFGTGYSSLSYLTRFQLDCLKIDRQFIRNIPENQDNAAITASIIAMAGKLDIDVVAEGVEKPRQIEFLRKLGCDVIQGYVFSRPVPPAEFLRVKDRRFT